MPNVLGVDSRDLPADSPLVGESTPVSPLTGDSVSAAKVAVTFPALQQV